MNDVVVPDAAIQIDDKIAAASAAVDKNVIQTHKYLPPILDRLEISRRKW